MCVYPVDRGMSMRTQVIIHSGMLSLIDDRSMLMFKVCKLGKSRCAVLQMGERAGSGVDSLYRDTPTGSPSHTARRDHRLGFHASTQICSQPWRKLCRYEMVAFKK